MTKTKRSWPVQLLLLACLLVCIVLAACVGKYPVSPLESLKIMLGRTENTSEMTVNVVLGLRVPRILASVIVGGALSMSGAAYQGIFKNPLVSPDFLGVSSGACIGAAVAILMSLSAAYISVFAFIFGIAEKLSEIRFSRICTVRTSSPVLPSCKGYEGRLAVCPITGASVIMSILLP